ncbi:MAG: hypothetical protein ACLQKA_12875 [Bryobacteraceae bacterium]
MAIRREVCFATRVPERWETAVSDDCALSAAVHRAAQPTHAAWFRRWGWMHTLLASAFGESIDWR